MMQTRRFGTPAVLLAAAALALCLVVLLAGTSREAEAAFPGANGKIVFESDRKTSTNPEGDTEIFTINPNGTGLAQLTRNAADDYYPSWSADGLKIAFVSERNGTDFEVYRMSASGAGQTNLTNNPASDARSDWQPK